MRVVVIGAGLGGLTLAQGLRQAGIDVAVHEPDGALGRAQGVGLHIDNRGAAALEGCLPPEHAAMADATMGGLRDQTLSVSEVDGTLAVVDAQPSDGVAGRARPGRQAHRPLLRAILLTGLEDAVRFEAEFTRFERQADGTVRAWFSDGSTDTADVLVGADGVGSAIRRQYLPHARVVDTGRRMVMGATALAAVAELPDLIRDNPAVARIRGVLGALRFASPPAVARQRLLPALRHSAVSVLEDYLMWALPDPAAELPAALRRVVDESWPEMTSTLRIGMIPPIPFWPASPVTVLGDAIHLAPGFGGNLAMQDAHRLCEALISADCGQFSLVEAIGAYEDASVPVPAKASR
ncbi:FAD-dependent oxidoreductase [Amycolatopsis sp. NPDC054798]